MASDMDKARAIIFSPKFSEAYPVEALKLIEKALSKERRCLIEKFRPVVEAFENILPSAALVAGLAPDGHRDKTLLTKAKEAIEKFHEIEKEIGEHCK